MGIEGQNGHWEIELREDSNSSSMISVLVEAGVQVEEVRKGKASLEEVYVTLMEEER